MDDGELRSPASVRGGVGEGVLVVLPPASGSGVSPATMVAGMPLLRRIVLAGRRAGFTRIFVRTAGPTVDPLLDGTGAMTLTQESGRRMTGLSRIVLLPLDVVPQARWLRGLRERRVVAERLYTEGSAIAVVETRDGAAVLAAAARGTSAQVVVGALRGALGECRLEADPGGRFWLGPGSDAAPAESWLLRSLVKKREGFMSRYFERRISLAITRRLARLDVTPDAMTVVSLVVGLAGAPFFLSAEPRYQVAGALLFLAHSVLDGCDGELARLTFRESPRGALLDFWGDNVVHVAVFACMAVGLAVTTGAAWPLGAGALTVAATVGAAAGVSGETMRDAAPGERGTWPARLAEALGHRDFIYLVLGLSVFGKAHWFLPVAALGTPMFLLLLWWARARSYR